MNQAASQQERMQALLGDTRVIPVLVIELQDQALRLAETLLTAGLDVLEVTLRTSAALGAIEAMAMEFPQLVLAAGSVLDQTQLDQVAAAGAKFAVSPGHEANLLEAAAASAIPLVPGAVTASEAMHLRRHGYGIQKFFPAVPAGGIAALKALGGPLPDIQFMPTGGISEKTAPDWLSLPNVCCIGGSWMVPGSALAQGDYETIGKLARQASELARS